jgi:hypothetical protein
MSNGSVEENPIILHMGSTSLVEDEGTVSPGSGMRFSGCFSGIQQEKDHAGKPLT